MQFNYSQKEIGQTGNGRRGGGQGDENASLGEEGVTDLWNIRLELAEEKGKVTSLRGELAKQEALLTAYQEDNQKLYAALKGKEVSKSSSSSNRK